MFNKFDFYLLIFYFFVLCLIGCTLPDFIFGLAFIILILSYILYKILYFFINGCFDVAKELKDGYDRKKNNNIIKNNSNNNIVNNIINNSCNIKEPYVELYEVLKMSRRVNEKIGYRYGTYAEDGVLYDSKGNVIRDREVFFKKVEDNYINKHGYDQEHMDKKAKHKQEVDEYLKSIGKR